jgi:alanine racemase
VLPELLYCIHSKESGHDLESAVHGLFPVRGPVSDILEPSIAGGILRPTHLEVDLGQLAKNHSAIRSHVGGAQVMAVLKANAYGHGLVPVARRLESSGCSHFGLAYLEEGLLLRQAGIEADILVMGGIIGSQIPVFIRNGLSITASSVDKLVAIEECAAALGRKAKVHLKIDTGMERIGVHHYSAAKLLEAGLRCRHTGIDGVFSHFASADSADLSFARLQLERFLEALDFYRQRGEPAPVRHMANSGAILQLPAAHLDLVRPGILLYGVYPSEEVDRTVVVSPVHRWVSRVVYFKVVPAGCPVSYGSTWSKEVQTRMVTVPVGYGDGYHRRMSGSAHVLVRGRRCPVAGAICMDQIMSDIGEGSAYNGDEVVLLGRQGGEEITAADLARWAGTIPYEILTSINTRVSRVYKG